MKLLLLSLLMLPAAALAQADAPAPAEPAAAKERLICKTEGETGSLIRAKKRCYTAEQWDLIANQHRNNALAIQENNAGRSACPAGASC